jgi:ArsR family transcriptional regulator
MKNMEAARALSALGHETRLSIFRALVQAGPQGMPAGEIARLLDLAPNALTFHLKDLTYAGLADSRQSGRYVIYSAVFPAMNALLAYLTENCCDGGDCGVSPLITQRAVGSSGARLVAGSGNLQRVSRRQGRGKVRRAQ